MGRIAQSVGHLTCRSGILSSTPGLATYFRFSFHFFKKSSCQLLAKVLYVHRVLVNCLRGLSLPRKSVIRLTDRPDMTLDVYHGRKTTIQQYNNLNFMRKIAAVFLWHCLSCLIIYTVELQWVEHLWDHEN